MGHWEAAHELEAVELAAVGSDEELVLAAARARARHLALRDKGNLATIGRAAAVADIKVVRLSGFPAWAT